MCSYIYCLVSLCERGEPGNEASVTIVIDCKLARTDSKLGRCSGSCSVVVALCCTVLYHYRIAGNIGGL